MGGELTVQYSVSQIAEGQFTATASVPSLLWSATDGNLTLHRDGTLEVQYPSNGIVEYWRRADGAPTRHRQPRQARSSALPSRPIKLVIRHFGPGSPLGSSTDLGWHWGLAIGDENACYEVAGSMAVIGPNGILAASSPLATNIKPTHLRQYDAFLSLPQTTQRTDAEVKDFCRQWVRNHPIYNVLGPNCQTSRGPLQLPLRPEPAVLQVGVPHRQVRPWTRAPPIDPVDQAREAALLTLVPHRLRASTVYPPRPHSMARHSYAYPYGRRGGVSLF